MRYLYVDNFRGFTDSYIPIKDVNFLVGENSTGKTSILSLIKLLGSPGFWLAQEFNTREIELGYFKDIVSISSEDKTYFKVGAIYSNSEDTAKTEAFLMTFSKKEGLPIIHQYNYMRNQQQVKIIFSENQIKYKVLSPDLFNQNVLKTFRGWTGENEKKGFKVINQKDILFSRTEALAHIDNFIESLLKEKNRQADTLTIRTPGFASLVWLAPIRSKPKRTYDDYQIVFNPEGEHTPYLIKRILGQEKAKDSFLPFINEFGEESGLFDSVDVKRFGKGATAPFELHAILNDHPVRISNIGYGVSQALPVVVEFFARSGGSWFAIQQPEIHLHPKAQAALGDIIFKLAVEQDKKFLVETHSDYIIDRFRLNYRDNDDVRLDSQVLFFERTEIGNRIHSIAIEADGEYSAEQPETFREFFMHEQLKLLRL